MEKQVRRVFSPPFGLLVQGPDGGVERPLGSCGLAASSDHRSDRRMDGRPLAPLAVRPAVVPVRLSAAAAADRLPQLEAQAG